MNNNSNNTLTTDAITSKSSNPMCTEVKQTKSGDSTVIDRAVDTGLDRAEAEKWKMWEETPTDREKKLYEALKSYPDLLIKGKTEADTSMELNPMKVLGEFYYGQIRPEIVKKRLVPKELPNISTGTQDVPASTPIPHPKGKKEKKVVVKKIDKFRLDNALATTKEIFCELLSTLTPERYPPMLVLNSQYLESVGIGFINMVRCFLSDLENYRKRKQIPKVLGLMISMQRFIKECETYKGIDPVSPETRSLVSKLFLADMRAAYADLDAEFKFNGCEVAKRDQSLLSYAPLDQFIPTTRINLRKHQKEIVDVVFRNIKKSLFSIYNAMTNSGKTTVVVALAELARCFGKVLLCVCNLDTVRDQMCTALNGANLSYAIAYNKKDGNLKISQTWSKGGSKIDVIVAGTEAALRILNGEKDTTSAKDAPKAGVKLNRRGKVSKKVKKIKEEKEVPPADNFIMFFDEPTVGASNINSTALVKNTKVFLNAPKWTIYSSATSPPAERLQKGIDILRKKYNDLVVETVYSPTVHVACELRTEDGENINPFNGCKTKEDILRTITTIAELPYIGRMISFSFTEKLHKELTELDVPGTPDINQLFRDVAYLKPDSVRELAINMLKLLAETQPSSVIERICSSSILEESFQDEKEDDDDKQTDKKEDDEDETFSFSSKLPKEKVLAGKNKYFNPKKIASGGLWTSPTLIVKADPIGYALENTKELFELLEKKAGYKSAASFVASYDRAYTAWSTATKKQIDNMEVSEVEKGKKEAELSNKQPSADFPDWAQIGSKAYWQKLVAPEDQHKIEDIRSGYAVEDIINRKIEISASKKNKKVKQSVRFLEISSVPDELVTLLFVGIGIYAPSCDKLDKYYNTLVTELAVAGKLAYVIADDSITFGTNQPYGRVIVDDEYGRSHSIHEIVQLIGRVGRVGKLAKAEAITSPSVSRMLIDFVVSPEKYYIESENINRMIDIIENEKKVKKPIVKPTTPKVVEAKAKTHVIKKKEPETLAKQTVKIRSAEFYSPDDDTTTSEVPTSWDDSDSSSTKPATKKPVSPKVPKNQTMTEDVSWEEAWDNDSMEESKDVPKDVPVKDVPKDVPVKDVPKDVPVKAAPKDAPVKAAPKDAPVKAVPSKDVPSKAVPSKTAPVKAVPSKESKTKPTDNVPKNVIVPISEVHKKLRESDDSKQNQLSWRNQKETSAPRSLRGDDRRDDHRDDRHSDDRHSDDRRSDERVSSSTTRSKPIGHDIKSNTKKESNEVLPKSKYIPPSLRGGGGSERMSRPRDDRPRDDRPRDDRYRESDRSSRSTSDSSDWRSERQDQGPRSGFYQRERSPRREFDRSRRYDDTNSYSSNRTSGTRSDDRTGYSNSTQRRSGPSTVRHWDRQEK
jgi:hypothetical protein